MSHFNIFFSGFVFHTQTINYSYSYIYLQCIRVRMKFTTNLPKQSKKKSHFHSNSLLEKNSDHFQFGINLLMMPEFLLNRFEFARK
jgi:hypothetical protein